MADGINIIITYINVTATLVYSFCIMHQSLCSTHRLGCIRQNEYAFTSWAMSFILHQLLIIYTRWGMKGYSICIFTRNFLTHAKYNTKIILAFSLIIYASFHKFLAGKRLYCIVCKWLLCIYYCLRKI